MKEQSLYFNCHTLEIRLVVVPGLKGPILNSHPTEEFILSVQRKTTEWVGSARLTIIDARTFHHRLFLDPSINKFEDNGS